MESDRSAIAANSEPSALPGMAAFADPNSPERPSPADRFVQGLDIEQQRGQLMVRCQLRKPTSAKSRNTE